LTPAPVLTRPPGVTPTPPPVLRSVRPRRTSQPRPPLAALEDEAGRRRARKAGLAGLLLIAFSCGMMFMVAVDRLWPRPRAACEGVPAETLAAATPARGVEVVREPAPAARVGETRAAADPIAAEPKAAVAPPIEPVPVARPLPVARPVPAPPAQVVRAPVVAPRAVVPTPAPAPVAHGRVPVTARKRGAGTGSPAAASETLAPTEAWTDPFAK
jgi:hypothetical protein